MMSWPRGFVEGRIALEELASRIVELALEQRTVNRLAPNEWKEIRG